MSEHSGQPPVVPLSPQATRMLMIPRRVWHVDINLGTEECMVMNHPTEPYDYAGPDRRLLPRGSPDIPVNLPRASRRSPACSSKTRAASSKRFRWQQRWSRDWHVTRGACTREPAGVKWRVSRGLTIRMSHPPALCSIGNRWQIRG